MTLAISARVRPNRSATTPKTMPPTAEASSVSDPSRPAVGLSMPRSPMSDASTSAYSITSNESSIHPRRGGDQRAARVRRCVAQPRQPGRGGPSGDWWSTCMAWRSGSQARQVSADCEGAACAPARARAGDCGGHSSPARADWSPARRLLGASAVPSGLDRAQIAEICPMNIDGFRASCHGARRPPTAPSPRRIRHPWRSGADPADKLVVLTAAASGFPAARRTCASSGRDVRGLRHASRR